MRNTLYLGLALLLSFAACKKDEKQPEQLKFSVAFDETLPRLGNLGQPVGVPQGNAAQHPDMQEVSIHYIELATDSLTRLGDGAIVYKGAETTAGGDNAVDFDKAEIGREGQAYISVNLSDLPPGTYNWVRASLTYQKAEIEYLLNDSTFFFNELEKGTLAAFVGFNNYITTLQIKDSLLVVNDDKVQGFWAFETQVEYNGNMYGSMSSGEGAGVTVVNPINSTSPVPAGSCVVTGKFPEPLVITGDETEDVEIVLAFSINNSFEWTEVNEDGYWEPGAGETIADMGLRGLHPYVKP